jgi:hypothetical protein
MSIIIKSNDNTVDNYFHNQIVSTIINELEEEVDLLAAEKEQMEFKNFLAPFADIINRTETMTIESQMKNNSWIMIKILAYSRSQRKRQHGQIKKITKYYLKKRDKELLLLNEQRLFDDAFFDELYKVFEMPAVSELEVAAWQCKEVQTWARHYGFFEDEVISRITRYNLNGTNLLNSGITAEEIGVSSLMGIAMFKIRIKELRKRDLNEKAKHVFVEATVLEEEGTVSEE